MIRHIFSLLVLATLFGCPPNIDAGDGGDGPIHVGPEGGIFIRAGYGVEIPRGAVEEATDIFVTIFDTGIPEVPMRTRISAGYRFSPSGTRFKVPVKIFLPWIPERVPKSVDVSTFDMRRQSGGEAYAELSGAKTNTDPFQAVEAVTDRLGVFWVTSPSRPNIDRIEIEPTEVTLSVGDTKQLSAKVLAPSGELLDTDVSWSLVPPRVASTTDGGRLTATGAGVATVTATAGLATGTMRVFVRGTETGVSTFAHHNPFPTGNDLHGGALAPAGLGVAFAGTNGTVLARALDGTWRRLASSPGITLTAVAGTTEENAAAIGRAGSSGVLVEFNGASVPPAVRTFPPNQISDLVALWFDGTHGMGVGSGNDVVIRRDGGWTTEYHPSFEKLLSVIGNGAGAFVVVGDLGSIYRWDPATKAWNSLYERRLAVKFDAAVLVNFETGETWAAGGHKLWHFVSGAWTAENLPEAPAVDSATAIGLFDQRVFVGASSPVVVGRPLPPALGVVFVRDLNEPPASDAGTASSDAGTTSVDGGLSPDGGGDPIDAGVSVSPRWTAMPLRGPQVPRGVISGGPTSTVGFVVGTHGAVWEWNATASTLEERSRGFYGDVQDLAVTAQGVFAGVNECANILCATRYGEVMVQKDGGLWAPLENFPTIEPIVAVAARSAYDVAVATTSNVYQWNGSLWAQTPIAGQQGAILDLKFCGNTLWAVGKSGAVYEGRSDALSNVGSVSGSDAYALHCPIVGDVWVAGDGFLASRDGTGRWVQHTSAMVQQRAWRAVYSPGGGEGFAFGDARYGVYWNSASLTAVESLGGIYPEIVTGMWGSSMDNLYMVGEAQLPGNFGFALRFDGVDWHLVDSGAFRTSICIDGNSASNVWIGTRGGGVLKARAP
jgi:hypothetical protein